jgi:hypothetical protein
VCCLTRPDLEDKFKAFFASELNAVTASERMLRNSPAIEPRSVRAVEIDNNPWITLPVRSQRADATSDADLGQYWRRSGGR